MRASRARAVGLFLAVAVAGAALLWLRRERLAPAAPPSVSKEAIRPEPASTPPAPAAAPGASEAAGESRLADSLNAPGGTIQRDLEILNEVFLMWQTNFPHDGNPVGENHEITAALTGGNAFAFAFVPRRHPAINARGELCDRWGTPFRFHQLSGREMEIRSAGPDRKFGTADDALWPPP
jgi:hypothetical protein